MRPTTPTPHTDSPAAEITHHRAALRLYPTPAQAAEAWNRAATAINDARLAMLAFHDAIMADAIRTMHRDPPSWIALYGQRAPEKTPERGGGVG